MPISDAAEPDACAETAPHRRQGASSLGGILGFGLALSIALFGDWRQLALAAVWTIICVSAFWTVRLLFK
jgi:hypothetical protein